MVGFGDGPVFDVSCCEVSSAGQPVAHQDADDGADDPVAVQGDLELLDLMTRVQCRFGVAGRCQTAFGCGLRPFSPPSLRPIHLSCRSPTSTFGHHRAVLEIARQHLRVQSFNDGQSTSQGVA